MVFEQDAEKVVLLTRPIPACRDAPFPRHRARFTQKLQRAKAYASPLRLPRPCVTAFVSILQEAGRPCFSEKSRAFFVEARSGISCALRSRLSPHRFPYLD
jgi:hypothetical protein